jgi:hypothetical protein
VNDRRDLSADVDFSAPSNCRPLFSAIWGAEPGRLLYFNRPSFFGKLTTAQVAEIRALAVRLSTPEIARRFDVSPGTIGNILAGRTWREPANETHLA